MSNFTTLCQEFYRWRREKMSSKTEELKPTTMLA